MDHDRPVDNTIKDEDENDSLLQQISDTNVMPDGMLTSLDQTNVVNLLIGEQAIEENISAHHKPKDLAP